MNTMKVAVTGTVHATATEVPTYTFGQIASRTVCSGRMVKGYVQAPGESEVNCPKCLAKI